MDNKRKSYEQSKTHEKRSLSRLKTFVPCRFQLGETTHEGRLVEVSLAGAAITCVQIPQTGEAVTVSVDLPEQQKSVSFPGRIVRVTPYISDSKGQACRFAVRFNSVTPDSIKLVQAVMSKKTSGEIVARGE